MISEIVDGVATPLSKATATGTATVLGVGIWSLSGLMTLFGIVVGAFTMWGAYHQGKLARMQRRILERGEINPDCKMGYPKKVCEEDPDKCVCEKIDNK